MTYQLPNLITLEQAKEKKYYIALDTETTGLFQSYYNSFKQKSPRLVSIGLIAYQANDAYYNLVYPETKIPDDAIQIHKITNEEAKEKGKSLELVLKEINIFLDRYPNKVIIGHNIKYDYDILVSEFYRKNIENKLSSFEYFDTAIRIKSKRPRLYQLYRFCFSESKMTPHNALEDAQMSLNCFIQLSKIYNPAVFTGSVRSAGLAGSTETRKNCKLCKKLFPKEVLFTFDICFFCL